MDNTFNARIFSKNSIHSCIVQAVYLFEFRTNTCNLFNVVDYVCTRVRKIIYDNYLVTTILKLYNCMRTDVTSSTCNQNSFFHIAIKLRPINICFNKSRNNYRISCNPSKKTISNLSNKYTYT